MLWASAMLESSALWEMMMSERQALDLGEMFAKDTSLNPLC